MLDSFLNTLFLFMNISTYKLESILKLYRLLKSVLIAPYNVTEYDYVKSKK
jgi:hypothetical protein